jgi:hypothetical protein
MIMTVVRTAAWLFLLAIFVMTVGPIGLRPVSPVPAQTERFTAFLIVGGLLGVGYPKKPPLMIAVVVVSAGLFELAQHLVPNRHGMFADFVAKAAGGAIGVLVTGAIARTLNFQ